MTTSKCYIFNLATCVDLERRFQANSIKYMKVKTSLYFILLAWETCE